MDLRMPELSGNEAIQQLRLQLGGTPMVMVVVTASAFKEDRQKSIDAGADDFLPKPFREGQLLDLLKQNLGLEWEYAQDGGAEENELPDSHLLPSVGELSAYTELALAGNLLGLRRRAESLMEADPKYGDFCRRLIQLAREFKVDEIQEFIAFSATKTEA